MVCDLSATTKRISVGNKFPLTESAAFEPMGRDRPDAVFVAATPFLTGRRVQLAQLAAFHRLPAIYAQRDYVEVAGPMS